jgi:hypothetical protein
MVMETLFPDAINIKKVIPEAKLGHDILKNFKMLQAVLEKKKIDKVAPVDCLMRMKYQDNLEFLQWIKCFHERQSGASSALPSSDGQSAESRRVSKAPRAPLGATGAHLAQAGRPSLGAGLENVPPKSPKGNSSARAVVKPQRPSSVGLTAGGHMQEERSVQSAKDSKRPPAARTSLAPRVSESAHDSSERLKALEKTAQDMSVTVLCARPLSHPHIFSALHHAPPPPPFPLPPHFSPPSPSDISKKSATFTSASCGRSRSFARRSRRAQ